MKKIIECACYGEGLVVEPDEDGYVQLSFWQHGQSRRRGISQRIRHILKIIRDGVPYSDMVMLTAQEAKLLANSLTQAVEESMLAGSKAAEPDSGNHSQIEVQNAVPGGRSSG